MPFSVTDFHDLIRLLEEHPDWRTELRRVLFSQDLLDLPGTVQELAIAQHRTQEALTRLTERLEQGFADASTDRQHIWERLEAGFAEAAAERHELRQDLAEVVAEQRGMRQDLAEVVAEQRGMRQDLAEVVAEQRGMRQDLGRLKGMGLEHFYRDRATAIFGRLLAQGHDATNQVADRLQEARRTGLISDHEYQEALAADLLWSGQLRDSRQVIVLVLEASWAVGTDDVQRAARRAGVLQHAGLRAVPVAAGQEWPASAQTEARGAGVAMVEAGMVDQPSWEAALAGS